MSDQRLDTNEVQVNNLRLHRVTLNSGNLNLNFLAIQNQSDWLVIESIVLLSNDDLVVINNDGNGFLTSTINNGRNLFVTTQAAARTFPQVGTLLSFKYERHSRSLFYHLSECWCRMRPSGTSGKAAADVITAGLA